MVAVMNEEVSGYFSKLIERVDDICALIISDRDGVPLVRVTKGNYPEIALRSSFLATFGTATDQASKLGLSHNRHMICMYENYQVVLFNHVPLVLTVIANSNANTGLILGLEDELSEVVNSLKQTIDV